MRANAYVGKPSSALAEIAREDRPDWVVGFEDDGYLVEYWKPDGADVQEPHAQDEFYFITAGAARIDIDGRVHEVAAGSVVFVPAQLPHRFFDQSDDLEMWIVFTGRP